MAAVKNTLVDKITKNTDDFTVNIGNMSLNVGNFKDSVDELLKDYTDNSCIKDFLEDVKKSADTSKTLIETNFNPTRLKNDVPPYLMKMYDTIESGVDERAGALKTHFNGMEGLNETCYLEKFREGYRALMFEFGTEVPDLLDSFKKIIDGRLMDSAASMVKWVADLAAGIDVCKENPYTPFCIDAYVSPYVITQIH